MSKATEPPPGGQASGLCGLPIRLFSLTPDLGALRSVVEAADHHLAALRVAAEDAVDIDPMMSPLVLYSEVHTHGPALADQLFALRREIDFLAEALSGGQHHVS